MAIDTAVKRFSIMGLASPSLRIVRPDGTIDQGDRQTYSDFYSGILADAPPVSEDCGVNLIGDIIEFTALNGVIGEETTALLGEVVEFTSLEGAIGEETVALQGQITEFLSLEGKLCC
jgi:hypothetical protein